MPSLGEPAPADTKSAASARVRGAVRCKLSSLGATRKARRLLDANRMPPLGSAVVDEAGLDLVGRWIDDEL